MVSEATQRPLIEHFSALKDPRQIWKVVYPLPEIMLLVLCATLAGAEDFVEARLWGVRNLAFLRRFLPFVEGIPSHDTPRASQAHVLSQPRNDLVFVHSPARQCEPRLNDRCIRSDKIGPVQRKE